MKTKLKSILAIALCAVGLAAFAAEPDAVQLWKDGPYFATCNVGADTPEGYGILTNFNDAAQAVTDALGSDWHLPTEAEWNALLTNCGKGTWTEQNGVKGRLFTGTGDYKSNSIFLPAAGFFYGGVRRNAKGYYWSSEAVDDDDARDLGFDEGDARVNDGGRSFGFSVRAVRNTPPTPTPPEPSDEEVVATAEATFVLGPALAVANVTTATHWPWDGKIDVTCDLTGSGNVRLSAALTTNGVTVCTATAENVTGATTINLDAAGGVTNGVKFVWNAKADCPADFNSTDTKVKVTAKKFTPPPAGQLWEKGPIWAECNVGDGATVPGDYGALYTFDDNEAADAAASLGADWRLPTAEEFTNLLNNCEKNWETCKDSTGADRAGYRFTGKGDYSSNSIYLPAAGFTAGRERLLAESNGYYWSSKEKDPNNAWILDIRKDNASVADGPCERGMSVRAVRDAK